MPLEIRRLAEFAGWYPRRKGKSVLVWGRDREALASLEGLLGALSQRNRHLSVYSLCPSASARGELERSAFPTDVLSPAAPFGVTAWLALQRARTQLLLLAGPPDPAAARLAAEAARQGVAVVAFCATGGEGDGWRRHVDLFITREEAAGQAPSQPSADGARDAEIMEALQPFLAAKRLPKSVRGLDAGGRPGWGARLLGSPLLAPLLRRKFHALRSIDALSDALGQPRTLLCLGNGPSSEDPRLRDLAYDALFRVNHFWLARGFLTQPQAVFTGLRAAIRAVRGPVLFVFQTLEEEQKLKLKCLFLPRRITFATAEQLAVMDFTAFGAFTPTNGAVMLATAVALQPERLVIAGMDLFQHPAGSYPGDSRTTNAYTVLHDRDTELQFILACLAQHRGELVILSEVLECHWRSYQAGERQTAQPPPS